MNEVIVYLAKASVGMALFYLIFWLTLRKETTFKINRAFLITSLLISIILPLIPITYKANIQFNNLSFTEIEKGLKPIISNNPIPSEATDINWLNLIPITYLLGVTIFFARLIWQSISLLILIYKNKARKINNTLIVENHKYELPFSFLNIVFINPSIHKGTDLTNILAHEKVHIREQHWFDLIIIELVTVFFWFNPFVWLYERSIKQNHEYLADEGVLAQGFSIGRYQAILINQIMGMQIIGLTNNLNYSMNKKRMSMMTKTKSPKVKVAKLLWALPAIALLTMAFAKPEFETNTPKTNVPIQNMVYETMQFTGKIVDGSGLPLEGASIVIYGKTSGTTSDKDGLFNLKMDKSDQIVISYVGFVSRKLSGSEIEYKLGKSPDKIVVLNLVVGEIKLDIDEILKNPEQYKEPETPNNKVGDEEFVVVEQLPSYPGGLYEFAKKIRENLKKCNPKGTIILNFTINREGNPEIEKWEGKIDINIHFAFRNMKKWDPGKQRGKSVPVNYTITVNYE